MRKTTMNGSSSSALLDNSGGGGGGLNDTATTAVVKADPLVAVVVARPPDSKPLARRQPQGLLPVPPALQHLRRNGGGSGNSGKWKCIMPTAIVLVLSASVLQLLYFHHNSDALFPTVGSGPHLLLQAHSEWKLLNSTTLRQEQRKNFAKNAINDKDQPVLPSHLENPLYQLFQAAGVSDQDLTNDTLAVLPHVYESMVSMYGDLRQPLIVGLDTCATYRQTVPLERRYTAVAGLFNTGTNAMEFHLEHNMNLNSTWQVPWGKHRVPALTRLKHVAPRMEGKVQTDVLPIVMVRDPFHWMQSMVRARLPF
jgi:hypothetical protein